MHTRYYHVLSTSLKQTCNLLCTGPCLLTHSAYLISTWLRFGKLVLYIAALMLFFYFLYYELVCVSPVCAYYTGSLLSPLLNKFKTIGRTYRPSLYLFCPNLQWVYLTTYCQLNLRLKTSRFNLSRSRYSFPRAIYRLKCCVLTFVLDSFLFRKIFRSQVQATFREAVDGQNGALTILDWYLPEKMVQICSECGYLKSKIRQYSNATIEVGNIFQTDDYAAEAEIPPGTSTGSVRSLHSGSKINALKTTISCPTLYDRDLSSISLLEGIISELNEQMAFEENQIMGVNCIDKEQSNQKTFDITNSKVARGVVIVIGDMNVSYNVSFQQVACNCVPKDDNIGEMCENCTRDRLGLNIESPTILTGKCLISDLLQSGFICVNIHLNVNLGMASEAFPDFIGLRSFPISLYSNVLVDLDCVLNRISERFPNSPLLFVSVGFGANILMEYISLASSHRSFKAAPDNDQDTNPSNLHPMFSKLNTAQNIQTCKLMPITETSRTNNNLTFTLNHKSEITDSNLSDFDRLQQFLQIHDSSTDTNDSQIKDGYYTSKIAPDKKALPLNDSSSMSALGDTCKTQEGISNADVFERKNTNSNVENIGVGDNKESTVGTRVVFPQPQLSELSFNIKKISAAVCINLNFREHDNVLHNVAKTNDYDGLSPYRKHCLSSLNSQLLQLLNQIRYSRKKSSTKGNHRFSCGHHGKGAHSGHLRRLFSRSYKSSTNRDLHTLNIVEQTITRLHREYHHSYREMRKNYIDFINYGSMLFENMGIRSCADFKVSILMTLKHKIESSTQETRGKPKITEVPIYTYANKRINTRLRLGRTSFDSHRDRFIASIKRFPDNKISKHINGLINREYVRNISNIRKNLEYISVPTLFLYSLDTSLFGWKEIDIFDVIKNPNFVYYVCKSGGYSTFLTGLYPFPWFVGPTIEFLEEMATKSLTF